MRIIVSNFFFAWNTPDECFQRARDELGIDGVEISFHPSFERMHCTRDDIEALAAINDKYGLALSAHLWDDLPQLGPDKGAEALLGWLGAARQTGVREMVIHGGTYHDRREGIERACGALEKAMGAFEREGVILHVENHYPYDYRDCHEIFSEPWEFLELFSRIDSPSLRFCFDTGHAYMQRNSEAMLRELGRWLNYVHLADNRGVDDDHVGYKVGGVPFDADLAAWKELGYDATFCMEFPVRDDMEPFHHCVRDLKAYQKQLQTPSSVD